MATATGPTLVYDSQAEDLYWDVDGAGAGAPALLAHLAGQPLNAADFLLV